MTDRSRLISRLNRAIAHSQNYRTSRRDRHSAARRAAALAERLGLIDRPAVCQACFCVKTLYRHHPDHSNPISVQFLCKECHLEADRNLSRKKSA
jgi:hypothetical protein